MKVFFFSCGSLSSLVLLIFSLLFLKYSPAFSLPPLAYKLTPFFSVLPWIGLTWSLLSFIAGVAMDVEMSQSSSREWSLEKEGDGRQLLASFSLSRLSLLLGKWMVLRSPSELLGLCLNCPRMRCTMAMPRNVLGTTRSTFNRMRSAEGRRLGSFSSICPIIFCSYLEQKRGREGLLPSVICRKMAYRSSPRKGGERAAISQRVHPRDQISELLSQGSSRQIQGLAQQGVPVWVRQSCVATLDTFRSPNLAVPCLVRKTLAGFMSLWMVLRRCSAARARESQVRRYNTCSSTCQIYASEKWARSFLRKAISRARSPPSANSRSRYRQPFSQKASRQAIMWSCSSEARMRTSFRALSWSLWVMLSSLMRLRAYTVSSAKRRTLKTEEQVPSPILRRIWKSQIVECSQKRGRGERVGRGGSGVWEDSSSGPSFILWKSEFYKQNFPQ